MIVNAQDVKINKLNIRSAVSDFDLNAFLLELTIEENLFKPNIFAELGHNHICNIVFLQ